MASRSPQRRPHRTPWQKASGLLLALICGLCLASGISKVTVAYALSPACPEIELPGSFLLAEQAFTSQPADYVLAKACYEYAAAAGHGMAKLRLGFLSAEAHFPGLTPDLGAAERWFKEAALQEVEGAAFRLGNFYLHYKTPPNEAEARRWLTRAANDGHHVAMFDLARLLMAEDTATALDWLEKSAEGGVRQAQSLLIAELDKTDTARALHWRIKRADNPAASVFELNDAADALKNTDPDRARAFYLRAAQKGDPHARLQLMHMEKQP